MYRESRQNRFRAAAVITTVVSAALMVGCSTNGTTEASSKFQEDNVLLKKYGVEIPQDNLDIGMPPYADHMILALAQTNGWFDEEGITIGKPYASIADAQQVALLLNGDYDVTASYAPGTLLNYQGAPSIKVFSFDTVVNGLAVLASPGSNNKSVSDFMQSGDSFEEAVPKVMAQLKGKSFATDDNGNHRNFTDTIFGLGGFSQDDLSKLYTVNDAQMLTLANGGKTDFANPDGAAQTAQLLKDGWFPIIGVKDLVENLPQGDSRATSGIGNSSLSATENFIESHHDTILRLTGIQFRVIDALQKDIKENTTGALDKIVPVIEAAASIELSAEDLVAVYDQIDPLLSFEQQADYWTNTDSPYYFKSVYNPLIKSAQEAGVIKKPDMEASDFIVGDKIYEELVKYKTDYEALVKDSKNLTGDQSKLAAIAKVKYENRNYLDAYRIMKAAVSG